MTKPLSLSIYKPNFNDPRIKKRAVEVLAWCDELRLNRKGKHVHHDKLLKVFGNYRQHGFSQWLFANLLSQTGKYQPGVSSFTYKLKEAGYRKVHERLGTTPPTELQIVQAVYGQILSGDVSPEYHDTGDRRYHPIQNIQRAIRKQAFAGWWDYDIESCAPTLIYQFAKLGYEAVHGNGSTDPFPAVSRLIHDKVTVRAHLAKLLGLDLQGAKEILAALLFRASLAPSPNARVFSALGGDEVRFQTLIHDEFVIQLRTDVKSMWGYARHQQLKEKELAGIWTRSRKVKKASQVRMKLYLSLERRVMDAMLAEFTSTNLSVVLIHDGFMSRKRLDVIGLEKAVLDKTGFVIRVSEAELGKTDELEDKIDVVELVQKDAGETDDELEEMVK